ncbi:MAG: hypothetical protein ACE5L6_07955 [Candidatus Bathyarchaeia archaeon]
MRVTRLTVGKGKTTKPTEREEDKTYFELEMEIADKHEVETARKNALQLIEKWLNESPCQPSKRSRITRRKRRRT